MKKQILFLAMFTMALIFAGTGNVFGQLLPGITGGATPNPIDPLSCIATSEPLHPFAGVPYIYSLDGASGPEVAASYTWWATKDINFITGEVTMPAGTNTNLGGRLTVVSGDLVGTSANYGTTTPAATAGADEIEITWSAGLLSGTDYQGIPGPGTPTFVVGYAEGANCADNIQVYEINPLNNFTIDIAAIDTVTGNTLDWDDVSFEQCVDDVQSATYNTTSKELDMDYGHNTIYFEVAAANFVTNWTPQFQITGGLASTQTAVISLHNSYADARSNSNDLWTSGTLAVANMNTDITTGTALTATNVADIATGVSVYVRVYIDNNTEESLGDSPFTLVVDAVDATTIWDMEDEDCSGDPLVNAPDQIDEATITITPRPTLDHNTVDTNLTTPNDRVIKTN